MKLKITRKEHMGVGNAEGYVVEELGEVDKVLAASDVFPYWTVWYPQDSEDKVKVRFFAIEDVKEVELYGDNEDPTHLASVTSINKNLEGLEI